MALIGFDADQDVTHVLGTAQQHYVNFICRYYKNLSLREAQAISAAGINIVSIYESTAERALQGSLAGHADGMHALDCAAALRQPQTTAVYATADFDEQAWQDNAVTMYFSAFRNAVHKYLKLGVYANGAVCQEMLDRGLADYTWLCGGHAMRGSQAFLATRRATLVQDVGDERGLNLGISIDSDYALNTDYGGWKLP